MRRDPVTSSNVADIGYDPQNLTLEVGFVNGTVYQFFDVPEWVYQEFRTAPSPGTYFHQNIKKVYRYGRL